MKPEHKKLRKSIGLFFILFFTSYCGANFFSVGTGKAMQDVVVKAREDKKIAFEGSRNEMNFFYKFPKSWMALGGYFSQYSLKNKFKPISDQTEVMDITSLGFRGYRHLGGPFLVDLGLGGHQSSLKTDPNSGLSHKYNSGFELSTGFSFVPCLFAVCIFMKVEFNYKGHSNGKDLDDSTATLRDLQSSGPIYSIGIANWWNK